MKVFLVKSVSSWSVKMSGWPNVRIDLIHSIFSIFEFRSVFWKGIWLLYKVISLNLIKVTDFFQLKIWSNYNNYWTILWKIDNQITVRKIHICYFLFGIINYCTILWNIVNQITVRKIHICFFLFVWSLICFCHWL